MSHLLLILFSLIMFGTLGGCYAADPYPTYPVYADSYAVYETERYYWEPRRSYKRERFWDRDDRDEHDGPHGFRDGVRSREGRRGFHR